MPSNTLVSGTPQKNDQTKRNTGLFVSFLDSVLISMLFRRLSYLIMRLKAMLHWRFPKAQWPRHSKKELHLEEPGFFLELAIWANWAIVRKAETWQRRQCSLWVSSVGPVPPTDCGQIESTIFGSLSHDLSHAWKMKNVRNILTSKTLHKILSKGSEYLSRWNSFGFLFQNVCKYL